MNLKYPRHWIWVALNLAGMALYLKLASALWVQPGGEGQPGGPGDAFYWLFFLLPILGSFFVLDLSVLVAILFKQSKSPMKMALLLWSAIVALWCGTVAFDRHKAFTIIDARYCLTSRSTRTQPWFAASSSGHSDIASPRNIRLSVGPVNFVR